MQSIKESRQSRLHDVERRVPKRFRARRQSISLSVNVCVWRFRRRPPMNTIWAGYILILWTFQFHYPDTWIVTHMDFVLHFAAFRISDSVTISHHLAFAMHCEVVGRGVAKFQLPWVNSDSHSGSKHFRNFEFNNCGRSHHFSRFSRRGAVSRFWQS